MRITNSQKKELSEIFRRTGLNILDFNATGQHKEFKVKFKYEYYSFSINIQKADSYSLTIYPIDNTNGYTVGGTSENTLSRFTMWAKQIATELNTSTGWETFESENYLNTEFKDLEQRFTEEEKIKTRISINELKEKIRTLDIASESLQVIEKKLDALSFKINDMSKFDWKSLFIGSIANLIMTLSIPPNLNGMIWEYIKAAFSGLKLNG